MRTLPVFTAMFFLLTAFIAGNNKNLYGTYKQEITGKNGNVYTSTIVVKQDQTYDETEYSKNAQGATTKKWKGKWVMKGDTLIFTPVSATMASGKIFPCDPKMPNDSRPIACIDHMMVYKQDQLWFYNDIHKKLVDAQYTHKKVQP